MRWYRADLHIHSVLSPCGDLDMSPVRIIHEAKNKKLDIIAVTDHNHTGHTNLMTELGSKAGITVFPGVEINTLEEIHCLAFFENIGKTNAFQQFIDDHLSEIRNIPEKFGYQLIVNEKEEIIKQIDNLLISSLSVGINDVEKEVHRLNGIFIPAHIDKGCNSIFSQLGFIPDELEIDAFELSSKCDYTSFLTKRPELENKNLITNSDAHMSENIGISVTEYYLEKPSFAEWKLVLKNSKQNKIRMR